jgi:autoinducer 2-degrading protein
MLLRRAYYACIALILGVFWISLPQSAHAQEGGPNLYVVTHVDVNGPGAPAEAAKLLQQFAADSRKDPGSLRFEVLREPNRLNHFTIVEVWQDRQAFETHLGLAHSRDFRQKIQPLLGSPFDEHLHNLLQ